MKNIILTRKRQALLFVGGYVIAVLSAVFVTVGLLLFPTILPDEGLFGSFYKQLEAIFAAFAIGLSYTSVSAFPGYAASLILAHRKNCHSRRFYILAGIATAVLAHLLFYLIAGDMLLKDFLIFAASLPGGAAGAYAYFLWRQKMLSVWSN